MVAFRFEWLNAMSHALLFLEAELRYINRGFYELLRETPINALHFLHGAHFQYHRTLNFLERFCGTLTVAGDGVYVNYSSMGQ